MGRPEPNPAAKDLGLLLNRPHRVNNYCSPICSSADPPRPINIYLYDVRSIPYPESFIHHKSQHPRSRLIEEPYLDHDHCPSITIAGGTTSTHGFYAKVTNPARVSKTKSSPHCHSYSLSRPSWSILLFTTLLRHNTHHLP